MTREREILGEERHTFSLEQWKRATTYQGQPPRPTIRTRAHMLRRRLGRWIAQ